MRFGFIGPSYTALSTAIADEELINWFPESVESQGSIVPSGAYGGRNAQSVRSFLWTPGVEVFSALPFGPVRGSCLANDRLFAVGGPQLVEVASDGTQIIWDVVANDGLPVSIAFNGLQILIVGAGKAYCFTLATNLFVEVTSMLSGIPVKCREADTYFIVQLQGNKIQLSQVRDGTTWPGQLVEEPSVFPENITSIEVNHRELWVFGAQHCQPYQDTGSTEVDDVIPGALMETGTGSTFSTALLDNSIFWIGQDARGGRMAWRSNGYTPSRISTHAVEADLASYSASAIAGLVSYSYQDGGHLFWVLYIPGSSWSWVYDVTEGMWHKRAKWVNGKYLAHWGWNHVYAFGRHLIGDWDSGNLYEMSTSVYQDNGTSIRRLRRSPYIRDEKNRVFHVKLTVDFQTGVGPQPPLLDGDGNPRPPQAMLRWADEGLWSNERVLDCGFAGQYKNQAVSYQLGVARDRVYEVSVTDPVPWTVVDAYLVTAPSTASQ